MKSILTLLIIGVSLSTTNLYAKKKITCKQMTSCAEAKKYLKQGYKRLDRDHDGVPCESICPGG